MDLRQDYTLARMRMAASTDTDSLVTELSRSYGWRKFEFGGLRCGGAKFV
jgi:hypothetical protein